MNTQTDNPALIEQLSNYASYHRDRRNIWTHFVGVPMIVLSIIILFSRHSYEFLGLQFSVATWILMAVVSVYFKLDFKLSVALIAFFSLCLVIGHSMAGLDFAMWLTIALGLFVLGWAFQFLGHYYEGKKPAFLDDVAGLLIGPLFVAAEAAFVMGLRKPLQAAIEANVGAVR